MDDLWGGLELVDDLRRRRQPRPRATGLAMVIDTGLGARETEDLLESAGHCVDLWKLSFGTSVLVPPKVLRRKLELLAARGITSFPGGTLFEAAVARQDVRDYLRRLGAIGFTGVEIADGTRPLLQARRQRMVELARQAGMFTVTEVGSKDPRRQPTAAAIGDQARADLAAGAQAVVIEGRESGRGVGVFAADGTPDPAAIEEIAARLGVLADRLVWEAPLKTQQCALIARFGPNVGLGNIDPRQVLAVEALRAGLRFESLKPVLEEEARRGAAFPEAGQDQQEGDRRAG